MGESRLQVDCDQHELTNSEPAVLARLWLTLRRMVSSNLIRLPCPDADRLHLSYLSCPVSTRDAGQESCSVRKSWLIYIVSSLYCQDALSSDQHVLNLGSEKMMLTLMLMHDVLPGLTVLTADWSPCRLVSPTTHCRRWVSGWC